MAKRKRTTRKRRREFALLAHDTALARLFAEVYMIAVVEVLQDEYNFDLEPAREVAIKFTKRASEILLEKQDEDTEV